MAACLGAYVATALFSGGYEPDVLSLICCGAKDRELILGAHEWWRLVSAGFLHGGIVHLLVNLYALRALGRLVEQLWGRHRFVLIYVGAVVGGNLASLVATPGLSVGASGGVFGLFGAIAVFSTVYGRFIRPEARRGLWVNLLIVAGMNIALGITVPFIDNAAHGGGFAAGALAALLLRPIPARKAGRSAAGLLLRAATFAAVLATVWSLAEAVQYALSADWILLARTEMEPRTVARGTLSVAVPKGWAYEPARSPAGRYVFVRKGIGAIELFLPPPEAAPDVVALARRLIAEATRGGATLVRQRDAEVARRLGIELVFRRTARGAPSERRRVVVFPVFSGRIICVSLLSPARSGFRLDLLFDLVVQSIRERGEPARAQSPWEQFIADPRDPEACTSLAAYYIMHGRPKGAEGLLHLALAVAPAYADAHDQLAYLYATASPPVRNPAWALRHARRALRLAPDTPAYLATLARAHEAAGDRAGALEAARRAAALAPDDASYADLVGRLEREAGGKE